MTRNRQFRRHSRASIMPTVRTMGQRVEHRAHAAGVDRRAVGSITPQIPHIEVALRPRARALRRSRVRRASRAPCRWSTHRSARSSTPTAHRPRDRLREDQLARRSNHVAGSMRIKRAIRDPRAQVPPRGQRSRAAFSRAIRSADSSRFHPNSTYSEEVPGGQTPSLIACGTGDRSESASGK